MDCAFAIQGTDYILIASDRSVARSIIKIQDSDDKLTLISDNQILAACGEVSDRKSFTKLIFGELDREAHVSPVERDNSSSYVPELEIDSR